MGGLGGRILVFFEDIKIEHSVFALPFALTSAVLAGVGERGALRGLLILKILLALFFARTSAMAFNRLVDAPLDARNPRTAGRALPMKTVSRGLYGVLFIVPTVLFVAVSAWINPLCFYLFPVALLIILGYPYAKRVTSATHFFLGLALAAAPLGAWIAVREAIEPIPVVLGISVLLWTAGFDIIYACLDVEFDRRENLHSLPARLGIGASLSISGICHILAAGGLLLVCSLASLGPVAYLGVAVVAGLLLYEHRIVKPDDLSRVNTAFFTINGIVSVLFFAAIAIDVYGMA